MTQIHFQLSLDDYPRLCKRVYKLGPHKLRRFNLVCNLVMGVGVGLLGGMYLSMRHQLPWLPNTYTYVGVGAIVLWLFHLGFQLLLPRWLSRILWRPDGDVLQPQTLDFDEQALVFSGARMHTRLPWAQVLARDEDAHNV